ncbi:MAG: SDR family NAD(P)-dependent oxidoreductase [Alphaproteobacteria bacterium]|nr:SDR family NAD(P)-dependent oxidoreductase [Alphaproteobacteria bacterium]
MAFASILITGGSSGLGAALARSYAGPDVALGLIGRDEGRLAAVAAECRRSGATVEAAAIDVADGAALGQWIAAFDRAHPVDLVVANAGTSAGPGRRDPCEAAETTLRQIAVNLLGAVHTVAPLMPAMAARGGGRIALIASVAAYRGLAYSPGYCASKAGLRVYGEALRALAAPHGVGVTVVCPGFFASRMTDRWDGPRPLMIDTERAAHRVRRGIDRGRGRVTFPWPLAWGLRLCDMLPARLADAIVRQIRFRIRPA